MSLHYTLRLNVMTGTPEYRDNAAGYMFMPLDQAARKSPQKWIIPNRPFGRIRDIDNPLDKF